MKKLKFLIFMALMIGLSITANCQTRKDSSIVAVKDLRKAAILIERGKACEKELTLQEKQIDLLIERVVLKDSSIQSLRSTIDLKDMIIGNHKKSEALYKDQKVEIEKQYKKVIKQQRLKMGAAGGVIALLTYLLIK